MKVVGRYELGEQIGYGGMAVVYLARQVDLDREVALKELRVLHAPNDPDQAERFLREARMAGSLSHPNIVTVLEHFEDDGTPYIAMEYLERGSLRAWIGRMSIAQIAGVLEGLLAALDHAEFHGIVHRDLKPENVLITRQGQVKVADFGIAKARTNNATLTVAGSTVGTPTYMAPEQAMARELGPCTDLYSLGVMAYEMFVGETPFADTTNPFAMATRHVNELIPSAHTVNPTVDREISDWIDRLLVKDPTTRTQSAEAAWDEFENIIVRRLGSLWRREARLLTPTEQPVAPPLAPAPFTDVDTPTPTKPEPDPEGFDFSKPVRTVPTPEPLISPEQDRERRRPRVASETGFVTFDNPGAMPTPDKAVDKPERHVAVVTPPPDVRVPTPPPEAAVAQPTPAPVEAEAEVEAAVESLPDEVEDALADEEPSLASPSYTSALTVRPEVVSTEPAPHAPDAAPPGPTKKQVTRRRLAVIGGAFAVVATVGVVAIVGGGSETPKQPVAAKPQTFDLKTADLTLTFPLSWQRRAELPRVPGLSKGPDAAVSAQLADGAYVAGELKLGDADPTLLPAALLRNVDGKLPRATKTTLGGRETLIYDALDVKGVGAKLRVYATLTEDGVATVFCGKATPARCDAVASSMKLTSAHPMKTGPTPDYQAMLTSASRRLDGRLKELNDRLDDAKTLKGKANLVKDVGRAYTSAIAALGGGADKSAREQASDLNPVDAGLNKRLIAGFQDAAAAYAGMSSAISKYDVATKHGRERAARRAVGDIADVRRDLRLAGYTGGPSIKPRSNITLPRKVVATQSQSFDAPPANDATTPPPANNAPPANNPPPALSHPPANKPPPPAVIIED